MDKKEERYARRSLRPLADGTGYAARTTLELSQEYPRRVENSGIVRSCDEIKFSGLTFAIALLIVVGASRDGRGKP
jgi:hypothetical protein